MSAELTDEFIPTRQSLLERLRRWDDQASWQEFFDTYCKLIYRTALKAGLSHQEAEDAVQETVLSVAKTMPTFEYRPAAGGGSFKQWLLTLTKWRINDQLRKRVKNVLNTELAPGEDAHEELPLILSRPPDPIGNQLDAVWDLEWEQNLLDAAMERIKSRTAPKHYQIFYLCALKGWSAWKVAKKLRVSLPQVYTVKHRVKKEIQAVIKQLKLKIDES